jgi:hypothetical protein
LLESVAWETRKPRIEKETPALEQQGCPEESDPVGGRGLKSSMTSQVQMTKPRRRRWAGGKPDDKDKASRLPQH